MSVAELATAIALGIVLGKVVLDLIQFIVEYPAQRRRNKQLKEMLDDMKEVTDRMIADIEKRQKPKATKVKVTKATTKKGKK